jgi:DNA-directed RNA polymerase specialized sigma24 family protein
MLSLTPSQSAALDALVVAGSQKEAAARMGISLRAFQDRMEQARHRNRMTTPQLVYWHRRTVWDVAA